MKVAYMRKRNILMPVRTVAEWGGVHEWTVDAASAFISAGHSVTFVGAGELFAARAKMTGAKFEEIDWASWQSDIDRIAEKNSTDIIFSHGPQGRMLGLALNRLLGVEHSVMIHGAYHDFMHQWSHEVDAFLAASPSLVHFTQRFGRVEPWKVVSIPNAANDSVFELPLQSMEMKLENGVGRIITASRLSKDKLSQIDAVEEALYTLREIYPDVKWQIDVFGDGPLKKYFDYRYKMMVRAAGFSSYKLHGWIPAEQVPLEMNKAFLTVTAGMAGVRAIASGSLCIGVGARNNVGLQFGKNLRAGLWSNFGDHGIFGFPTPSISEDLKFACAPGIFEEILQTARETAQRTNSQKVVDSKMLAALQL